MCIAVAIAASVAGSVANTAGQVRNAKFQAAVGEANALRARQDSKRTATLTAIDAQADLAELSAIGRTANAKRAGTGFAADEGDFAVSSANEAGIAAGNAASTLFRGMAQSQALEFEASQHESHAQMARDSVGTIIGGGVMSGVSSVASMWNRFKFQEELRADGGTGRSTMAGLFAV